MSKTICNSKNILLIFPSWFCIIKTTALQNELLCQKNIRFGNEGDDLSIPKYNAVLKTIETGSITAAAEQLGYTQSAVSRMIADLEREWGIKLLQRSRAGISVSSEGFVLLPLLQSICNEHKKLEQRIEEIHHVGYGLIRVGTVSSVSMRWLPQIMKSFREVYPNINFYLRIGEYNDLEEWLRRGEVDCSFVSMPSSDALSTTFLKQDRLLAVLPVDHPLAALPRFPLEQLAEEPFIKLEEDKDYEISKILDSLSKRPKISYQVIDSYTILSMVECGLGVSILHELSVDNDRFRVVGKEFDTPLYRNIGIAVKKDSPVSPATQRFISHPLQKSICRL